MTDRTPGSTSGLNEVLEYFTRRCLALPIDFKRLHGLRPDPAVCAVYFLLDLVSGPNATPGGTADLSTLAGVDPFIQYTLARLLLQLSHSTEQHPVEYHAQVRGRVLWNATYKARFSEEYNPSIYVCAEVRQRYDNPENQLLKYLLERIECELKDIPPAIRNGRCYLPYGETRLPQDTAHRLEALETAIHRLKRSARLREITTPIEINERHLLRAETSRTEEYTIAAELYFHYKGTVLRPSWSRLAAIARRILPLPAVLNETTRPWVDLAADLRSAYER
jgi:hypothetical protein